MARKSASKEKRVEEALGRLVEARQENARLRQELTRAAEKRGAVPLAKRGRK